jgi:hypothetical protein
MIIIIKSIRWYIMKPEAERLAENAPINEKALPKVAGAKTSQLPNRPPVAANLPEAEVDKKAMRAQEGENADNLLQGL